MTTDCGPVMLFPSHICFKVMFELTIMLIYQRPISIKRPFAGAPRGWPLNRGSTVNSGRVSEAHG